MLKPAPVCTFFAFVWNLTCTVGASEAAAPKRSASRRLTRIKRLGFLLLFGAVLPLFPTDNAG